MSKLNKIFERYFPWTDDNLSDVDNIPHYCVPSLNARFEKGNNCLNRCYEEAYENLPVSVSSAIPFGEPALFSVENLNGLDPATELVHDKMKWEIVKEKIILANIKSKGHVYRTKNKSTGVKTVSPGILKLAEHLECDPDPNFCGRHMYNWYYSEGSLGTISYDDNYYMLSTHISTPGVLHVTPISITETDCIPLNEKKLCLHTDHKQSIFQTAVNNNFVALRQKNFATLFKINSKKKTRFKKVHECSELSDSIVSIAISNKSDGEYCTLTSSHKLKIWSPEKGNECKISYLFDNDKYCKEMCDHWGSVKYVTDNYLLYSTRDCVYLKDLRTSLNVDYNWWPPMLTHKCDYISLVMNSNFNINIAYVGTRHNLFELDLRKNYTKEWTHMMEFAPLFGASCPLIDGSETVLIGSQNINEVCLFESNKQVMPYILPSPHENVTNAKLQGICLDPMITTRCNFSNVGLTCVPYNNKDNQGIYVFRSTSVGDMFYQKVIKGCVQEDNTDSVLSSNISALSVWEGKCIKSIENFSNKPLSVTDIVDKTETYTILTSNKKRKIGSTKEKYNKKDPVYNEWWCISKEKLLEEQEPLAQCILDIWDIEDEDEWHIKNKRSNNINKVETANSNSIIESWFSNIQTNNETPISKSVNRSKRQSNALDDSLFDINDSGMLSFPSTSGVNSTFKQTDNEDIFNAFDKTQSATPNITKSSDHDIFGLSDDNDVDFTKSSSTYFSPSNAKKKVSSTVVKPRFSSGF